MKKNRRTFIRSSVITGIATTLIPRISFSRGKTVDPDGKRVGIIGLDTSHSTAFTKALNNPPEGYDFSGYKVVAAYPYGSREIESSYSRIPEYTEEVKKYGVEITSSVEELIGKSDLILLETNDGRLHLEQALPVIKAGKRMFIDKPMTASLSDAMTIFNASAKYGVPVFSSSSLRYTEGLKEIAEGEVGNVLGAETYSPATLEKTHPDLFWYGIHGVELLFAIMGTGCTKVTRIHTEDTDVVAGTWENGRIGTFRGLRAGKKGYGGCVFGEKEIKVLGNYQGYNPLLLEIIKFFNTGIPPVTPEETLEILAFMEAADESKKKGGSSVDIRKVMDKAGKKAN